MAQGPWQPDQRKRRTFDSAAAALCPRQMPRLPAPGVHHRDTSPGKIFIRMNAATAGLIGAIIGASAGLLGSVTNSYFQLELIEKRAEISQAANLSGELRNGIRSVARELLSLQHSMEWVCWLAISHRFGDPMPRSFVSTVRIAYLVSRRILHAVRNFSPAAIATAIPLVGKSRTTHNLSTIIPKIGEIWRLARHIKSGFTQRRWPGVPNTISIVPRQTTLN